MSDSFAISWAVAHEAPPWDFPGKNTEVGCHFLLQGYLPNPGIKPTSPALAGRFFTAEPLGSSMLIQMLSNKMVSRTGDENLNDTGNTLQRPRSLSAR